MYEISIAAIVAVIIGIEQILKGFGVNPKWVPVINLVLGELGAFLYSAITPQPWPQTVFMGIVLGLTASGLYSGVKNIAEGVRGE